jgi:peptide/nickel transport system permease protein
MTTVITALAASIPVFVLGFIAQQMFGVFPNQHNWPEWARLPVQGTPEHWNFFLFPSASEWRYLLLPMLVLASVGTALVARMTRTTMLEVTRADYMRTARAKGLTERKVVLPPRAAQRADPGRHPHRPRPGQPHRRGHHHRDRLQLAWHGPPDRHLDLPPRRPVVLGLTLVLVVAYVLINLLVDLSYGFFDPRVRIGKEKS